MSQKELIKCPICGAEYDRNELSQEEVDEIEDGEGCISLDCE